MSSYDLYASLGLDRGQSSDQLAAELNHRLESTTRDTPGWYELSAARAVLGDPTRRSMYDQRLDDPSQTVTPAEIQQLAAMNVGPVSGSTGGGLSSVVKEYPKLSATVGVLAVAVLAIGGLAIAGSGGGDDDTSNTAAGSNAAPQTEIADDDPHAAEKRQFRGYDFLSADEEYSVDADEDGTEDYAISVGNLRTATYTHNPKVDIMEPYEVTAGCVDITARLTDSAMADIRKGVDSDPNTSVQPGELTWGEQQGVNNRWEATATPDGPTATVDYDAVMKKIANATWELDMRWMKHGDNKWTGTVAPIVEDSRIWDKDYSEIVSIPRSLEDPADSEFRGDSTVQTRCFNGQFGWGAEGYPADDSVTGYFIYPYISTVSSDRSEREHTGWKFDK